MGADNIRLLGRKRDKASKKGRGLSRKVATKTTDLRLFGLRSTT